MPETIPQQRPTPIGANPPAPAWHPPPAPQDSPPVAVGAAPVPGSGNGANAVTPELAAEFADCADAWEDAFFLDMREMFSDPDYLRIIEMGPAVTPLILQRLQAHPNWWFPALVKLTGVDPTHGQTYGKLLETTAIWLKWAKEQQIIA